LQLCPVAATLAFDSHMREKSFFWVSTVLFFGCAGAPPPDPDTKPATTSSTKKPDTPSTAPEETAEPENDSGCPKGMRPIPAGTLFTDGKPKQEVGGFCFDQAEVTVAEYRACTKNRSCPKLPDEVRLLSPISEGEQADLSAKCSGRLDDEELPATCVDYEGARRYCDWKGRRLPSEVEYRWAASGGDDKLTYAWGSAPAGDEVVCWQRPRGACRVKSKPAEGFELYDLAGNVSEWTGSAYEPTTKSKKDKPGRVIVGGNWESNKPEDVSATKREGRQEGYRDVTLGFRCAK
jgi:formylglycine-generating enzyme required for sulfatase activity